MDKKRKLFCDDDEDSSFLHSENIPVCEGGGVNKKIRIMDADDDAATSGDQNDGDDQQASGGEPLLSMTNADDNFNPLNNNDTVLPKILSLLSRRDLWAARMVCRRWNELSAPYFNALCAQTLLYFSNSSSISPWGPWDILHGIEDMVDFTQAVRTKGTCPFRRFDINFGRREEGMAAAVTDFLSVCGPSFVEELNLRSNFYGYLSYEDPLEPVLLSSPLESLRILRVCKHISLADCTFLGDFMDWVTTVIKGSRNLDSFTLHIEEDQMWGLIPPLLLYNLKKLTKLEVKAPLTEGHLIGLSGIQDLELKGLKLILELPLKNPRPLRGFLERQSGSLETLSLSGTESYLIEFPQIMTRLKSLQIDGPRFQIRNFFSVGHQFPGLEALLLTNFCPGLFVNSSRCLTLRRLAIRENIAEGILGRTAAVFPKLKRLEIDWNRVTEVYSLTTILPGLEELGLSIQKGTPGSCIDEQITGIPTEDLERIRSGEGSYEAVNLSQVQRTPGITSLQRLKTLKLNVAYAGDCEWLRITQASFHLALFHMERLKTLDFGFGFTPLTEMPTGCMERIRKRFKIKSKRMDDLPLFFRYHEHDDE